MSKRFDDEWDDGASEWDDDSHDSNDMDDADDYESGDDRFGEPTLPCPRCHRPIYEEAEQCPLCGYYVSAEERSAGTRPWWILLGVLLGLYAAYRWVVG